MTMMTPQPKEEVVPRTMDFPDAIRKVIQGKKVTRVAWGNADYVLMKDGWLCIYTKGAFHTFLVSDGDTDAQDWTVLEDHG